MGRQAGRRAQPTSETPWIVLGAALGVFVLLGLGWGFAGLLSRPVRESADRANPLSVIIGQIQGSVPVTAIQVLVFVLMIAVFGVLGVALAIGWRSNGSGSSRVDNRARDMAHSRDMTPMMEKAQAKDSERLRATGASAGVPLARLVNNSKRLLASWEWVQVWIMGPRAGKTSCVCIPQIMETNGPVLATSNKRDIVDMTRGPRSRHGKVWVHDVQDIIGESASWFWNPLSFVTDKERAQKLTDVFESAVVRKNDQGDAYFGPAAKALCSNYIWAAAVGDRPITDVFKWANDEKDFTAVKILRENGEHQAAESLEQTQMLTDKQRDGVYGTVRTWLEVLGNPTVVPWLRRDANPKREEFDPEAFVRSTDTIYLISREGGGSARAITAALVMAILTTAEKVAAHQRGGRLAPPIMAVLDEAANVVRWPELPDLYSHYGSRGIVVSTFFQSYAQGVEAFGEHGMQKMWSAANIRVAGSGLSEDKFLPFLSNLIGDRDVVKRTSTAQRGGHSTSTSVQRERILEPSDLAQLPRGRAVLTSSGFPAALLNLEHFSQKPYAQDIKDSQDYYEGLVAEKYMKESETTQ